MKYELSLGGAILSIYVMIPPIYIKKNDFDFRAQTILNLKKNEDYLLNLR